MSTESAEYILTVHTNFVPWLINRSRVFEGGTFRFNVGPEVKAFVLHTKLVSRHSPVFHALMCGNMREAEEKQTSLRDVDEDTFIRFAEFIYGSDYNVAEPLIVPDNSEIERGNAGGDFPPLVEIAEHATEEPPEPSEFPMWGMTPIGKKRPKRLSE